jgi:hypothetical protein
MPENLPAWVKEWRFTSGRPGGVTRCSDKLKAAGLEDCAQLLLKMSEQLEALTAWCQFLTTVDWAQVPREADGGGGGGTPPDPPKWPP